jgi:hypothetical protein
MRLFAKAGFNTRCKKQRTKLGSSNCLQVSDVALFFSDSDVLNVGRTSRLVDVF